MTQPEIARRVLAQIIQSPPIPSNFDFDEAVEMLGSLPVGTVKSHLPTRLKASTIVVDVAGAMTGYKPKSKLWSEILAMGKGETLMIASVAGSDRLNDWWTVTIREVATDLERHLRLATRYGHTAISITPYVQGIRGTVVAVAADSWLVPPDTHQAP